MNDEYICKKCGESCEVGNLDGDEGFLGDAWCETCNDYPAGFHDGPSEQASIDYVSGMIDRAHDMARDNEAFDAAK